MSGHVFFNFFGYFKINFYIKICVKNSVGGICTAI